MSGTKNLFTIFQTTWPTGGGERARGGRWEEGGACPGIAGLADLPPLAPPAGHPSPPSPDPPAPTLPPGLGRRPPHLHPHGPRHPRVLYQPLQLPEKVIFD